jgi:hypothetical protein
MPYSPVPTRYDAMIYNRVGKSGLKLPAISFGLWQNFGEKTPHETKRAMVQRAFDLGITHFDLANNYGPPPGAAEAAFGEILKTDFAGYRDELIISTKAGYLHVARTLWRMGQPQIYDRQPRPEPEAHGARLCRHLLFAPFRSRYAAGGDDGRARLCGALRPRALCRHLLLQFAAHTRGGDDPA